jgi:two-component system response regulator PilR (NtrC family)
MQAKLLRVLQEKRVRRVGANDEVDVDVRVVAATNRSLEALVQERRFREDLFYRLNVIPIVVPPLRERREDIPLLAGHFLGRFSREMGKTISKISEEAMERLLHHSWPGNVRELENVIERAVALETSPVVLPERLPELVSRASPVVEDVGGFAEGFSLDAHLTALEADLLRRALTRSDGDRAEAARLLGVTPRSLRYLIRKHGAIG